MKVTPNLRATTVSRCNPGDLVLRLDGARGWAIVAARTAGTGAATQLFVLERPSIPLASANDAYGVLSAGTDYHLQLDHRSARTCNTSSIAHGSIVMLDDGATGVHVAADPGRRWIFDLDTFAVSEIQDPRRWEKSVLVDRWSIAISRPDQPYQPHDPVFSHPAEPQR